MTATTPSRPGRPRDSSRDEEILAAVLRLLEGMSYSELTIAAIARNAGVGKPTLYLRWASKASWSRTPWSASCPPTPSPTSVTSGPTSSPGCAR